MQSIDLNESNMQILSLKWNSITDKYQILKIIACGTFGKVLKARCKKSDKIVAIKLIENVFVDVYHAKTVLREIKILRQLTKMK